MREKLIQAHQELQQIFVRGIDTVHMANALALIEQVSNEIANSEKQNEE